MTDKHTHTLKRVARKTQYDGQPRYFLQRVCTTCPYRITYDMVPELPEGGRDV